MSPAKIRQRLRKHAKLRAMQRFGYNLTLERERRLLQRIQEGEGHLISVNRGRFVYRLHCMGHWTHVVVDRELDCVCTVYPSRWV